MTLKRTFLYAMRDREVPLRIKFGYETCTTRERVIRRVASRYGTYYQTPEMLQCVPVAIRGRDAEAHLVAALRPFHVTREFLRFPDEDVMRTSLAETYASLACAETDAHRVVGREGEEGRHQRRLREEVDQAVRTATGIMAAKAKLKRKMAVTERKQERKQHHSTPANDALQHWLENHISRREDSFVCRRDIQKALQAARIPFKALDTKRRLEYLHGGDGVHCKAEHWSAGCRYTSAWMGLMMSA